MQALNMHGDAATWEEKLLAAVRERDAARAEAGECRSEAINNKVQLLEARAEVERLRAVLEGIAMSGNVHPSWLVGDAKRALGRPNV